MKVKYFSTGKKKETVFLTRFVLSLASILHLNYEPLEEEGRLTKAEQFRRRCSVRFEHIPCG